MDSIRQQIKDKIKDLLSGNTAAGTNIFLQPVHTIEKNDMPAIVISAGPETHQTATSGKPARIRRNFYLNLFVVTRGKTFDATAEIIIAQIEQILGAASTLNNLVTGIYLRQITECEPHPADYDISFYHLHYECIFYALQGNPYKQV